MHRTLRRMRAGTFRLRKWYLDCVGPDGTTFIGYAARIGLGPIPVSYQATLWSPPKGSATHRSTLLPASLPKLSSGSVRWCGRRLGVQGVWQGVLDPGRRVLLDTAAVLVEWRCHLPNGEATISCPAGGLQGRGYVEELLVHGSLAKIPIQELRWGRFTSASDHVVWIEWVGSHPLRLVLANGVEMPAMRTDHDGVWFGGGKIVFRDRRTIRDARVGEAAFGKRRWNERLVPRRVAEGHEEKWLSRGLLEKSEGGRVEGWVLHERVTWP